MIGLQFEIPHGGMVSGFQEGCSDFVLRDLDVGDVEIESGEFGTGDDELPMSVGFGVFAGRAVREEAVTGSPDSVSVVA